MAFHPKGNLAYVVNELDSTITSYSYDAESGTLSPKQILTTLPQSYTGNS
ncbi:beta-propeller fold lactonase family protein, partial [Pseudomonas syringae group genomosp. 7]